MRDSVQRARGELAERLRARRPELEQMALTRIYAISDPTEAADPTYLDGLRAALSAALDYARDAIESGQERPAPVPTPLLAQARLAARNGVSLETVLRRYFAGYSLLVDVLIDGPEEDGILNGVELRRGLRALSNLFDYLVTAVTDEYRRETAERLDTSEQRRAMRIEALLGGVMLDASVFASEFGYQLDGHHLGLLAAGPGAAEALADIASRLDRRLLLLRRPEETFWAWLGGRRRLDPVELQSLLASSRPANSHLALGEPGEGLAGWRLSHRQAAAALPLALRGPESVVRYADVALLASMLHDDLLATSLHQLYLAPLEQERDGGETTRETLRAYFAAGRNVSSAAAALGVSRQAVNSRLRAIEERLGRPVGDCVGELETVLRMAQLGESVSAG